MSIMDCGCVQPWRILVVCQVKVNEIYFSKFSGLLLAIISKSRLLHRYLSRILNRFVTQLFWRAPPSSSFCLNSFFFLFSKRSSSIYAWQLHNSKKSSAWLSSRFSSRFSSLFWQRHFWTTFLRNSVQRSSSKTYS